MNNKVESVDISNPDPLASMIFFFIVTTFYCIINIFMGIGSTMKQIIMKGCYILFIIIGEYFINLNLSYSMCGVYQWQSVLTITIIPWLLIFGVLHLFLSLFPGWLSPFSNTFGYLAVKLMGLPQLMKENILNNGINTPGNDETIKALINVNSDQSLLINQMYPDSEITEAKDSSNKIIKVRKNFDTIWDKLVKSNIFKNYDNTPDDKTKYKDKLYHYVEMKSTVSEFIWNLLTGFLVTSVSYNYIINIGCKKSVQDMKNRRDAYEASQAISDSKKAQVEDNEPNYRQTD
jgi:hypothetical protein